MYQAIGKNKWDMYANIANCKYMQHISPLVASQEPPLDWCRVKLFNNNNKNNNNNVHSNE